MRSVHASLRLALAAGLALLIAAPAALAGAIPMAQGPGGVPTLAPLLERVTPAVVNIAVLQKSPEEDNPLLQDPFFRRFFGLPESSQPQMAAGSGVIVDAKNGYVLTNRHVIKDATQVMITLKDNRRFPARVIGSDAGTDIAVLQIKAEHLSALPFGDSDALRVGDFVVAIGNPFGIGQTVTSGIVSALGRSGLSPEGYEDFIQTDAPINPGNSGGALVDLRGELVGINSAIIGPSGGNVGIGFAVPSNMAHAVMEQLIRFGKVKRGRLGISMKDLTPELARTLGVTAEEGAVIAEVQNDSPAAHAGLQPGDVVVAIDGRPVRSAAELRARLGVMPVGEEVALKVLRGAQTRTLRARIGPIEARAVPGGQSVPELAGARFADAERSTESGAERVIVVTGVQPGSPADQNGLQPGDLVVGVNGRRVRNVAQLAGALRKARHIALNVVRGDYLLTISIR